MPSPEPPGRANFSQGGKPCDRVGRSEGAAEPRGEAADCQRFRSSVVLAAEAGKETIHSNRGDCPLTQRPAKIGPSLKPPRRFFLTRERQPSSQSHDHFFSAANPFSHVQRGSAPPWPP